MFKYGFIFITAWTATFALGRSARDEGAVGVLPIGGIYAVLAVRGEILIWHRFGATWDVVKRGDNIVAGELLQFGAESSLKVKGVVSGAGEKVPRGFVLKTEDPLVARLDERLFRDIQLGGYFISIPGLDKEDKSREASPITGAWRRLLSVFEDKETPVDTQTMEARLGSSDKSPVQDEAGELVIDHPKNGETYIVGVFPTEIAVSWSKLPPDVSAVKVFLWKSDQGSPDLVGQTSKKFLRLQILAGGRYYVRLESPDGRWRSKSHLVVILTPDQIVGAAKPDKATAPTPAPTPKTTGFLEGLDLP